MKRTRETIHTGDAVEKPKTSAHEIDRMLTELSQLYLERFKVLRTGDHNDLQIISDKITALKAKLNRL